MANKTVNWDKIKIEYITTGISQRKLAEKYKVPFPTLRDRCRAESWYQEKINHRNKVVTEAAEKIAHEQTELLVQEYKVACDFIKLLEKSLNEKDNYDEITTFMGEAYKTGRIDTKSILNAANSLQKFMDIKRICSDHQTVQERQQHEIALKRLQIEEKRAQKEEKTDSEIHISIDSEQLEKWKN